MVINDAVFRTVKCLSRNPALWLSRKSQPEEA